MEGCVLVIEDDEDTRDLVRRYLERDGFNAVGAATGAAGLRALDDCGVDLTVLDLGLPDIRGDDLLIECRRRRIPVVVLTARDAPADRIHAFELGTDDYVSKPFSPRELVLRVRAVLRRSRSDAEPDLRSFDNGRLVVDEYRHEVRRDGAEVHVTPGEWAVLATLAAHPGRAFSRVALVTRIHGTPLEEYERRIDAHVHNLRAKLEEGPEPPRIIETVPGVGYRFGLRRDGA